jgi:hypothetical protein
MSQRAATQIVKHAVLGGILVEYRIECKNAATDIVLGL